jgi:hypothetical protein
VVVRQVIAALIAVAIFVIPAPRGAEAQSEHILVDTTVLTRPKASTGMCIQLDKGTVEATLRLVGDSTHTVHFAFSQQLDGPVTPVRTLSTPEVVTYSTPVEAGIHCFTLTNAAVPLDQPILPDQVDQYSQLVLFHLAWWPVPVGMPAPPSGMPPAPMPPGAIPPGAGLPSSSPPANPDVTRVSWDEAKALINSGKVSQAFQTHALEVRLFLKDGSSVVTTETRIDEVFQVIRDCGAPCADIMIATE